MGTLQRVWGGVKNPEILWRYPWAVYHLCPKSDSPQLTWLRSLLPRLYEDVKRLRVQALLEGLAITGLMSNLDTLGAKILSLYLALDSTYD
jgi:hypothetical protein